MRTHERRLYGHRGASADLPENTLIAFESAIRDGATALELDVHVTSDGHVVVAHDDDGKRCAGVNRKIADCALAEIKQWTVGKLPDGSPARVPTLDDLLDAFPRNRLNADIKPRDLSAVDHVIKAIRRHDAEDRVTLASFHGPIMRAVHAAGYRGEKSSPPGDVLRMRLLPTMLLRRNPPRGGAVQIPRTHFGIPLDRPEFIARCHELGIRVDYWVINDAAEAAQLIADGADGIVSDNPGLVAKAVFGATGNKQGTNSS